MYVVGAPMERVGVDVLGPFPITESGNRYVLVAMDYFTKWPEVYVVPDQSAGTTASRLVEEMFAHFGAPAELHSSQVLAAVCKRLGVAKTRTNAPAHTNHTLTTSARYPDQSAPTLLGPSPASDVVGLPFGCAGVQPRPAELMFGPELRTPIDLVFGAPTCIRGASPLGGELLESAGGTAERWHASLHTRPETQRAFAKRGAMTNGAWG